MIVGYILAESVSNMKLVLLITFPIVFAICGVVKLAHWSLGDQEDIFMTHLNIFIRSEAYIFPLLPYSSTVVCLKWLYHHMLSISYISRESCALFRLLLHSFMMWANSQIHYRPMIVYVCLHFTLPHFLHYTDVSEGIEIMFRYILWSVCLRLTQFFQLSFKQ